MSFRDFVDLIRKTERQRLDIRGIIGNFDNNSLIYILGKEYERLMKFQSLIYSNSLAKCKLYIMTERSIEEDLDEIDVFHTERDEYGIYPATGVRIFL
ncbi:MAG: hypothetical protein ABEK59_05335 [Halobacteria archaeon]